MPARGQVKKNDDIFLKKMCTNVCCSNEHAEHPGAFVYIKDLQGFSLLYGKNALQRKENKGKIPPYINQGVRSKWGIKWYNKKHIEMCQDSTG